MQRAPEFTANYQVDLGGGNLTLSGNLYYTSSFFFDPSEQFKQNGYGSVWSPPVTYGVSLGAKF